MFIVECDGEAVGCIAVKYTRNNMAQLRYFFLEPEMRGAPVLEEFVILRQAAPISMYLIHWNRMDTKCFQRAEFAGGVI